MIKKTTILFFIIILLASCASKKPEIATSKLVYFKTKDKAAKNKVAVTTKKPATNTSKSVVNSKKPVVAKSTSSKKPMNQVVVNKSKPAVSSKPSIPEKKAVSNENTKIASETLNLILEKYNKAKEPEKSTSKDEVYSKNILIEATSKVKVTNETVLAYINQYKEIAKSSMFEYGIPASITLAQGILESGSGTGALSLIANNHFGIKCNSDWNGESVRYDDDEEQECFRKYGYASQSYSDHSLFLSSKPRYASLFQLEKTDYIEWAKGLKAAGYATDPSYPKKLITIIERYNLNKYDSEVLGIYDEASTAENDIQITTNNDEYYTVNQGDTLYSISKKFNLSIDELKSKNKIYDNSISIGQSLIVK